MLPFLSDKSVLITHGRVLVPNLVQLFISGNGVVVQGDVDSLSRAQDDLPGTHGGTHPNFLGDDAGQ